MSPYKEHRNRLKHQRKYVTSLRKPCPYCKERLMDYRAKSCRACCWDARRVPRIKHSAGYILLYQPEHPRALHSGRVYEHVLIAEKALGRYLKKNEYVHHINGIKDDNRNCNLLICDRSYHSWFNHHMAHLFQAKYLGDI